MNQAAIGTAQADQQFVVHQSIRFQVDHRFGVQHEAVVIEGFAESLRPQQSGMHLFMQPAVDVEHPHATAARFLGLVEGQIGIDQHIIGALVVPAAEVGDAAAGCHLDAPTSASHLHRTDGVQQLAGMPLCLSTSSLRQQDREFIPTHPRHEIGFT